MAAAATRERDAAIQAMRRKRLRDADPEGSASTQAADTAARAAARRRLPAESPAGSAEALPRDSAPRAELRSRVAVDALSSDSEGSKNDEKMAGVEGTARPRVFARLRSFLEWRATMQRRLTLVTWTLSARSPRRTTGWMSA